MPKFGVNILHLQGEEEIKRFEPAGLSFCFTLFCGVEHTGLLKERDKQADFVGHGLRGAFGGEAGEQFRVRKTADLFRAQAHQFHERGIETLAGFVILARIGLFANARELAKAEKINEAYLGRVLRLTLLSLPCAYSKL